LPSGRWRQARLAVRTGAPALEHHGHGSPCLAGCAGNGFRAPYVFRVAISNNRILKLEDGQVTFKYKESATDQTKFCTIPAEEFIRRFLQHVLPDRFIKLRYYSLCGQLHNESVSRMEYSGRLRRASDASNRTCARWPSRQTLLPITSGL
jgi:Putative transposase